MIFWPRMTRMRLVIASMATSAAELFLRMMVVFLSALRRLFADLLLELLIGDEGIEQLDHLALGARVELLDRLQLALKARVPGLRPRPHGLGAEQLLDRDTQGLGQA